MAPTGPPWHAPQAREGAKPVAPGTCPCGPCLGPGSKSLGPTLCTGHGPVWVEPMAPTEPAGNAPPALDGGKLGAPGPCSCRPSTGTPSAGKTWSPVAPLTEVAWVPQTSPSATPKAAVPGAAGKVEIDCTSLTQVTHALPVGNIPSQAVHQMQTQHRARPTWEKPHSEMVQSLCGTNSGG